MDRFFIGELNGELLRVDVNEVKAVGGGEGPLRNMRVLDIVRVPLDVIRSQLTL